MIPKNATKRKEERSMRWIVGNKWMAAMLIVVFVSALSGCEYAQKHQSETVGAGIGAAAGTAAGLIFGGTKAAIAGGLLGAIAGGVIGHYMHKQDQSASETAKEYNYQPSQGTVISIEKDSAVPDAVKPGEAVNLETTYALLVPKPDQEVTVTEEREIKHDGQLVGNPKVTVNRVGGTYSTSLPLHLPSNAAKGEYQVTTKVMTAAASDLRTSSFRVY
jgi:outer membrane lipoprotein SlyB